MDPAANTTTPTNFGSNPPTASTPSPVPADSSTTPVFQTVEQNNPASSPSPTEPATTVVVEAPPKGGGSGPKKILATLAVLLMLVGVGAGVFVVRNQDVNRTSAWDCSLYTFAVSENGTVTVANGSARREPQQQAQVYINDSLVDTLSVPALEPGEGATLGTISVPTNQSYSWRVVGTIDCRNSGQVNVSGPSASCGAVVAYDKNWAPLTAAQLSALSEGDIVRFAVSGTASSGAFERARFTINGGTAIEVTDKKPGSEEFYYEYKIPKDTYNFTVSAQIFHDSLGWF